MLTIAPKEVVELVWGVGFLTLLRNRVGCQKAKWARLGPVFAV